MTTAFPDTLPIGCSKDSVNMRMYLQMVLCTFFASISKIWTPTEKNPFPFISVKKVQIVRNLTAFFYNDLFHNLGLIMFENKIIAVATEKSWTFMKKYFFLTSIYAVQTAVVKILTQIYHDLPDFFVCQHNSQSLKPLNVFTYVHMVHMKIRKKAGDYGFY